MTIFQPSLTFDDVAQILAVYRPKGMPLITNILFTAARSITND